MAHQKLLIGLKTGLFITIFLTLMFSTAAFALDFTPGKWQVINWIELPDGRQAKKESSEDCLAEPPLTWGCEEPHCKIEEFKIHGNDLYFVHKMNGGTDSLTITGNIQFKGANFDGILQYSELYEMSQVMVILNGKLVGTCN